MFAASPEALQPYSSRLRYYLLDEHRIAEAARAAGKPLPDNLAGVVLGLETLRSCPEMRTLGQTLLAPGWPRAGPGWPRLAPAGTAAARALRRPGGGVH